ncbi:MAG: hypothetical protein ACRD20_12315 [Terriglobales bacterium]
MTSEIRRRIQLLLVVAIAAAGLRAGYVVYQRRSDAASQTRQKAPPLNPDYYVIPKKLYPYDLKSAKQLTQQPVWVREGYRFTYYPYDRARHHADFSHEAGLLLPIQKLEIEDVVTDTTPHSAHVQQVMAVFEVDGKAYAVPIGSHTGDSYQIYSDEMFFIQDPHDLYKHWPADVWQSIEQHQIKPGMNEFQAYFSIGMGVPERSSDPAVKTVHYPNGGKPVTITFRDGKAAEISGG